MYFAHNPPAPAPITLVVQGMAVRRHFPYFGFAFWVYTASLMHIYAISGSLASILDFDAFFMQTDYKIV